MGSCCGDENEIVTQMGANIVVNEERVDFGQFGEVRKAKLKIS